MSVFIMAIKSNEITTRFVQKEINKYNRKVKELQKRGAPYDLLETITRKEVIQGRSNTEIANHLKFLRKLGKPDSIKLVPYSKEGVKVPKFFREQVERNVNEANKLLKRESVITKSKSTYGGSIGQPHELNKGSGHDLKSIKYRAKTAKNRSSIAWYNESDKRFKENWVLATRRELGPYAIRIIDIVEKIPANKFYQMTLDEYYGPELEHEYIYGPDEAREKANKIIEALEQLS